MLNIRKHWRLRLDQWAVVAVWFAVILGQLQRWQITPGIVVYGHDPVIGLLVGWWLLKHVKSLWLEVGQFWQHQSQVISFAVTFLAIGWVVAIWLQPSNAVALVYAARVLVYLLFIWLSGKYSRFSARTLYQGWLVVGLGVAYLGFWQYLLLPDTRFLRILGWDDHYYRLISTWLDPAFTGLALAATAVGLTAQEVTFKLKHSLKIGLSWIVAAAVALTFSRASYLSLGVGWLLSLCWWPKKLYRVWWGVWLVGWVVFILVVPKPSGEGVNLARSSTVVARTTIWQTSLQELAPYQWLIGRGAFVPHQGTPQVGQPFDHGLQADNSILFSVLSFGIVGGLLWWLAIATQTWRLWRTDRVGGALLVMWLVHSLFNNSLFQPQVLLLMSGLIWSRKLLKSET